MPDKKKIIIALILTAFFLLLSVYLFIACTNKIWGVIPLIPILPYKLLAYTPTLLEWAKNRLKRGKKDISDVSDHLPVIPSNIISSINILLLKDFIQCIAYENYSVLGVGTPDQLKAAFDVIISQYHQARADTSMKGYIKLRAKIAIIETQWALVDAISAIMVERYSIEGAKALQGHYPNYAFSEETFLADMEKVRIIEISSKLKYEQYIKELTAWETKNGGATKTPEQTLIDYEDSLTEISKMEGIKYGDDITVLRYARLRNKLDRYIDNLKTQTRNGR